MKRLFGAVLVSLVMFVTSCKKAENPEVQVTPEENLPVMELDGNLQLCYMDANSTKTLIKFETETQWEIRFETYDGESVDWIKASPSSGNAGIQNVEVSIDLNRNADARIVRIIVHSTDGSTVRSSDIENIVDTYQSICFTASVFQYGYYDSVYGDPVKFKPDSETRLQTLVDEYVEQQECSYSDLVYLNINGILLDADFTFIRNYLSELKVLDMFDVDITEIPDNAFYGCASLHYVTLPLYLKRIGGNAFMSTGLKNINLFIPPLLEYVGANAFANTNIAGSLIFSGLVSEIDISGGAFESPYIGSVIFSEGIRTINGDVSSPFDHLGAMYLPGSLSFVSASYIRDASAIFCYPDCPPATDDRHGMRPATVGMLYVPFVNPPEDSPYASYDVEKDRGWEGFYSPCPAYNKLCPCL